MSDTNADAKADRPRRKASAFALAKTDFSVHAQIGTDDVQALRPDWSEGEVQAFLRSTATRSARRWRWPAPS